MTSVAPTLAPRNTPIQVLCTEAACTDYGKSHEVVVVEDVMHSVETVWAVDRSYSVHADKAHGKGWEAWATSRGYGLIRVDQVRAMATDVEAMEARVIRLNQAEQPIWVRDTRPLTRSEVAARVKRSVGDMTLAELSRRSGISAARLKRRLSGEVDFTILDLCNLSRALDDPELLTKALAEVHA